jgi:hypothetical protein
MRRSVSAIAIFDNAVEEHESAAVFSMDHPEGESPRAKEMPNAKLRSQQT